MFVPQGNEYFPRNVLIEKCKRRSFEIQYFSISNFVKLSKLFIKSGAENVEFNQKTGPLQEERSRVCIRNFQEMLPELLCRKRKWKHKCIFQTKYRGISTTTALLVQLISTTSALLIHSPISWLSVVSDELMKDIQKAPMHALSRISSRFCNLQFKNSNNQFNTLITRSATSN